MTQGPRLHPRETFPLSEAAAAARARGSRRVCRLDARSGQDSIELSDQRFLRAAKKIIYYLPERLGAGLICRKVGAIRVGAPNLSAFDHTFASEPDP